jgi:hypothetical protein
MPLSPEVQTAVVNAVARWLALNADADQASLTVVIVRGEVHVIVKERRRLPAPPTLG